MAEGGAFLPRILSVFYAVLDVKSGPKILYQVPEDLIPPSRQTPSSAFNSFSPPPARTPAVKSPSDASSGNPFDSPVSIQVVSPTSMVGPDRPKRIPFRRAVSGSASKLKGPLPVLFFEDISSYVIPASALCGRLVKCSTRDHRIIGFPVELRGDYEREEFRYNVCFVFLKTADLSCYEPLIRKIARVLTACEKESRFLSSPQKSTAMLGIIEQLYEDLNSYNETSIPIDPFNSIELKLLPFFPNPRPINDWEVPVPLIDLKAVRESNWDLTMIKVCEHIDGINHISRIAAMAECSKDRAREAIMHLLYYQVIVFIDIFGWSNIYTLRKSAQWLLSRSDVVEECAAYVTKPGQVLPEWPTLLHLYSRLKPGNKTVLEWMYEHEVHKMRIDVRRFLSFGMIKGFLRRVHRYPLLLSEEEAQQMPTKSPAKSPTRNSSKGHDAGAASVSSSVPSTPTIASRSADGASARHAPGLRTPSAADPVSPLSRRASAAERALESHLYGRGGGVMAMSTAVGGGSSTDSGSGGRDGSGSSTLSAKLLHTFNRADRPRGVTAREHAALVARAVAEGRRPVSEASDALPRTPTSAAPSASGLSQEYQRRRSGSEDLGAFGRAERRHSRAQMLGLSTAGADGTSNFLRLPNPRSPSAHAAHRSPQAQQPVRQASSFSDVSKQPTAQGPAFPKELLSLLNGETHTDALAVRFEAGWPVLEKWFAEAGGGAGNGDLGRVVFWYR